MKENWNFWSADWSGRVTVEWNPKEVSLKDFKKDIQNLVGNKFKYERSVSLPPSHVATKTGLTSIN